MPEDGEYDIDFGYALGGNSRDQPEPLDGAHGQRRDLRSPLQPSRNQSVNGDFATYGESSARVSLQAGVNTIRLTTNGLSGPNVDYLDVRPVDPNHIVIQAEALVAPVALNAGPGVLRPITQAYAAGASPAEIFRVGAEGNSYLDWPNVPASLDFNVTVDVAGTYAMTITYANGGGAPRPLDLARVSSGEGIGTFAFAPTVAPAGRTFPETVGGLDRLPDH